ncbi:MAG: excinuclease ABC subunit UvrC [Deltaproteobacteria bacterium]|nr:excinuclease ABC subunit UvrC [Deltaproteobacteria bacterium]
MKPIGDAQYELDPRLLRNTLPDAPGVYLFVEPGGRVIYVGKAKSLRKRVLSYFRTNGELTTKTGRMMKRAHGLDFILTDTEQEAFILEGHLIKKYMPRYNIILRDDKQYPCLCLDIREPFPRLAIVRKIKKDGALYFGPFSSANSVRSTKKLIDRVFRLRKCKSRNLRKRSRPCLNFQMNHCLAPCTYEIPVEAYNDIVQQVRLFLEGRSHELIAGLEKDMEAAAAQLDFEKAATIRDQIQALQRTVERQYVVSARMEDQDVIGLAQKEGLYEVVILFIRRGYLTGTRNFLIKEPNSLSSEVMEAVLKQHYGRETFIPTEILISEPIEDLLSISAWLSALAEKKVYIQWPRRGQKRKLTGMAVANAENLLAGYVAVQKEDLVNTVKSVLGLERMPRRIEGLDISNFQGKMAVGTIVSFVEGQPHRAGYRNFRIKQEGIVDDYAMMAEMVGRRVAKGGLPDLFLVDGGKGHLATVKRVLNEAAHVGSEEAAFRVGHRDERFMPEVISIAKPDDPSEDPRDKIYLHGRKNPLMLRAGHPVLLLMMRIRDEAHRRAVMYHRRLRKKRLTRSELDRIPGIGHKRKHALLIYFKDIHQIANATIEDLERVPGISRSLAEAVFSFFNGN